MARREAFQRSTRGKLQLLQVFLIVLTAAALGILLTAVGEGLLGNPEMFISGNGSTQHRASLVPGAKR